MAEQNQNAGGNEDQEILASEAVELLGIGHTKLAQMLKKWERTGQWGLPFRRSSLDRRVRLIKRSDIQLILQQSQGVTVEEARKHLQVSRAKMKELIKSNILPTRPHPLDTSKQLVDQEAYNKLLKERDAQQRAAQHQKE